MDGGSWRDGSGDRLPAALAESPWRDLISGRRERAGGRVLRVALAPCEVRLPARDRGSRPSPP